MDLSGRSLERDWQKILRFHDRKVGNLKIYKDLYEEALERDYQACSFHTNPKRLLKKSFLQNELS